MLMLTALAFLTFTTALGCDFLATDFSARARPLVSASIVKATDMQRDTAYKGHRLRLSVKPNADGTWTGIAQFLDEPSRVIETDSRFGTQSEALSGALSHAMAAVDRDRMSRGKP
jgi:hypothetical protein